MRLIDAHALQRVILTRRRDAAYFDDCGIEHDCLLRDDVLNAIEITPTINEKKAKWILSNAEEKLVDLAKEAIDTKRAQVVVNRIDVGTARVTLTIVAEYTGEAELICG